MQEQINNLFQQLINLDNHTDYSRGVADALILIGNSEIIENEFQREVWLKNIISDLKKEGIEIKELNNKG